LAARSSPPSSLQRAAGSRSPAIGLGASSAGAGAFFAAWRVPLLIATVALLGSGFYLVYRKPRCAPGEACEVPNPRLQRFNRGMLWLTTVFVAAFAFFPEYVGAFTGGGGEVAEAAPAQTTVRYQVKGMETFAPVRCFPTGIGGMKVGSRYGESSVSRARPMR